MLLRAGDAQVAVHELVRQAECARDLRYLLALLVELRDLLRLTQSHRIRIVGGWLSPLRWRRIRVSVDGSD